MAVKCSNCGEELLGAVNRCWKCGSAFVAPPTAAAVPPVRRPPIAEIYVTAASAAGVAAGQTGGRAAADAGGPKPPLPNAPARRRGSPFADAHTASLPTGGPPAAPRQLPAGQLSAGKLHARPGRPTVDYARNSAATGGAVAALLLGFFGLCGAYYIPEGALITAVLGIGMGLWGIYSDRKGLAIAGLLLCCLTLGIAGFFGAVKLFVFLNGRHPWEPDPDLQIGPSADF